MTLQPWCRWQVHPIVRHAHYTAAEYAQLAAAFSPASLLAAARGGLSLTRLPRSYIPPAAGVARLAPLPKASLEGSCTAGVCGCGAKPTFDTSVQPGAVGAYSGVPAVAGDAVEKEAGLQRPRQEGEASIKAQQEAGFVCWVHVPLLGGGQGIEATSRISRQIASIFIRTWRINLAACQVSTHPAYHEMQFLMLRCGSCARNIADAENEAALQAVQALQQRYQALFSAATAAANGLETAASDGAVEVLAPGWAPWKDLPPGTLVKVILMQLQPFAGCIACWPLSCASVRICETW